MSKPIEAVYERGRLRTLGSLSLSEGDYVLLKLRLVSGDAEAKLAAFNSLLDACAGMSEQRWEIFTEASVRRPSHSYREAGLGVGSRSSHSSDPLPCASAWPAQHESGHSSWQNGKKRCGEFCTGGQMRTSASMISSACCSGSGLNSGSGVVIRSFSWMELKTKSTFSVMATRRRNTRSEKSAASLHATA